MKRYQKVFISLITAVFMFSAVSIGNAATKNDQATAPADAIARLLGGMSSRSKDIPVSIYENKFVRQHIASSDKQWTNLEKSKLPVINSWRKEQEPAVFSNPKTLFYPFSGPDILYPMIFFPDARTYIMIGLEPVGNVPTVARINENPEKYVKQMQKTVNNFLNISFFRTNSMKDDFDSDLLDGVTPVILAFCVRTGSTIKSVQQISIDSKGMLVPWTADMEKQGRIHGLKVDIVTNRNIEASVQYFSTDIIDAKIKQHPEFAKYIKQQGEVTTMLKAASYLMHRPTFSVIRDMIIDNSVAVVQDDSGIPIRFFAASMWEKHLYGSYDKPINLFSSRHQPDLKKAYMNPKGKLPFSYGYKYRKNESNLMIATKKKADKSR